MRLQCGVGKEWLPGEEKAAAAAADPAAIAAAGITAIALYLLGIACFKLFGLPGPVAMLFIAVVVKLTRAVPSTLQLSGQTVYKFFPMAVTYPLLCHRCFDDPVGQARRRDHAGKHHSDRLDGGKFDDDPGREQTSNGISVRCLWERRT